MKFKKETFKNTILGLFVVLFSIASLLEIGKYKSKIKNAISPNSSDYYEIPSIDLSDEDATKLALECSQKITKGGYILFFRHAEREKWLDVQMYDSLESDLHDNGLNGTRYGEKTYFSKAVCLNTRGIVQVQAMKEVVEYAKVPVGYIVSSPSCRARQTAKYVFGKYDKLDRILVHRGPYVEYMDERNSKLKEFIYSLPILEGTNTIVTAHNGVVDNSWFSNVLAKEDGGPKLKLDEGGFYIISKKDGNLILEYEFDKFHHFSRNFFPR